MSLKHRLLRFCRANLPGCIIVAIVVACGVTFANRSRHQKSEVLIQSPSDVDLVLKNYHYSENLADSSFVVKGTELVRRGTLMLGLRSNLQKTTTLTDITGRFHSSKATLDFSAAEAEWETSPEAPLLLQRGVVISIGGKKLPDVDRAIVNLKQGRVTTYGSKRKLYYFK